MGLLENLAAVAIRNKVIAILKQNCPSNLQSMLEQLLSNKEAITAIQGMIAGNLKKADNITAQAILALPFSPEIRALLQNSPELVQYLVQTAQNHIH